MWIKDNHVAQDLDIIMIYLINFQQLHLQPETSKAAETGHKNIVTLCATCYAILKVRVDV